MERRCYRTVSELVGLGANQIPAALVPGENLIYSSPATLSYNSPGAQGFGVKRAGLVIPESVMLVVAPACCGRNTTILADEGGYSDRMFFLQMDETDLVTGRHLEMIPEAIEEILSVCEPRPKVVVICITCVDALLGTDLERITRRATERTGVAVLPSYMYALTREGRNPPMVAIRETIYSMLERKPVDPAAVNLLGYFSPLMDDTELYDILRQMGIRTIREVSRMNTLEEYHRMGEANFNLILHPEARKAAIGLEKRIGMPYAELARLYEIDRIGRQYRLFAAALGVSIDDSRYLAEAEAAMDELRRCCGGMTLAIGQVVNGNPVELALAMVKAGFSVTSVFANVSSEDYPYLRELAGCAPSMRIYSPLAPAMLNYDGEEKADLSIGTDAAFYYPESVNVMWSDEVQPFGYRGLIRLAGRIIDTVRSSR